MRKQILPALTLILFASSPTFAATEFYVVKHMTSGTCSVSKVKPDGKAAIMIGTKSYKTKAEATAAMSSAAECKKG